MTLLQGFNSLGSNLLWKISVTLHDLRRIHSRRSPRLSGPESALGFLPRSDPCISLLGETQLGLSLKRASVWRADPPAAGREVGEEGSGRNAILFGSERGSRERLTDGPLSPSPTCGLC